MSARCGGGTLLVSTLLAGLDWGALVEVVAIKESKTYAWEPLLLTPYSTLLHRTGKLPHSTNDSGNPALFRAGFKQ